VPGTAGAVLGVANVINNRVVSDRDDLAYVASSLGATTFLVGLARTDGRTWAELGLDPSDFKRSLQVGGAAAAGVAVALLVAAAHPRGRHAFRDDRAIDRGRFGPIRAASFRVPFGTVLLEEIAFRSVVPAILATRIGRRRAALVAAGLFGAWHILPSRDLATANEAVRGSLGPSRLAAAGFALTSTAAAGLGLGWLRTVSGSVVGPMLVHWTMNGLGYLLAGLNREPSSAAHRSSRARITRRRSGEDGGDLEAAGPW